MIYVAIYLLLCVLVPLGRSNGRKNIGLLAVVTVVLFLFVGFRWEVGCDWDGYLNIFQVTARMSAEEAVAGREPGFLLLNVLLHDLELDYFYINVVGALVFFTGLFLFARRQENPLAIVALSFPVLIINMPMSGVRQGIAIGFLMIAINAYRDGKRWAYAGAVLMGSAFHQSVLLFLGLAPLIKVKKTIVTVAIALLLTAPALYFLASGTIGFYAERYGEGMRDAAGAPFRAALLAVVGLFFFAFLRRRWRAQFSDDYEIFVIASAMMLATLPLALYVSIVGDRLGYYLVPFQIVVLERLSVLLKGDKLAPVYAAAPYVGLLVFLVTWASLSSHFATCYLPYKSTILGIE
jgi:EpsG family